MERLSTSASSRRSSIEQRPKPKPNPKYKQIFSTSDRLHPNPQQRLKANQQAIISLSLKSHKAMSDSYFFRYGHGQEENERFKEVFVRFFQELRGTDPLVHHSANAMANKFGSYSDVSRTVEYEMDAGDFSDIRGSYRSPTNGVILELKDILESEYGLRDQLLETMRKRKHYFADNFQLETRDTCFREFPIFPRIFPKCMEALQEILSNLLNSEWLQKDIAGIKLYLNENDYVDRPLGDVNVLRNRIIMWETLKHAIEQKLKHDQELNKHFRKALKEDVRNLAISGGLSFFTANPTFIAGGIGRAVINTIDNYVDPEGKQSDIQLLKVLGGGGLGAALGGNPYDLFTALSVDLIDLGHRPENMSKNGSTAWNTGTSFLKAIATVDGKKFVAQMVGHAVSEAAERVPEEGAPLDIRIALALLKNPDMRGFIIDDVMKEMSKEKPKPEDTGQRVEVDPESDSPYPQQEPTLEDLQRQAEYEQQLAEYEKWQKDFAAHTLAETNAKNDLIQKEAGVTNAEKYLKDKTKAFNKKVGLFHFAGKESQKLDKAQENKRTAVSERDTAQKVLDDLQGIVRVPAPKPKAPKPKTVVGKVWNWTKENVSASGEVTVASKPLYTTKPSTVSDRHIPAQVIPSASRPQISQPRSNMGQWEGVQQMQQQQMFNANMAYQSPNPQQLQPALNYQAFWGQGMRSNVQAPPMDLSGLGRSETVPYQNPQRNTPVQMAGLLPFVLTKVVPEQTQKKVETWVKTYIQEWKDDPIKARKDMDLCLILGAKNVVVVAIQAFEQPSLKTRPNAFGLMEASDRFDNWFAGKANIDLTSPNAQMGMFVGEFAMPIPMVGAFKHCTKVGQEAFAFMRQANKLMRPQPLMDRMLAFPQGFSKEVRAIEAFQNPVYRSGFVPNKAIEQARKAVNLPSWKKIDIWMEHILSGHTGKGWRTGCKGSNKSLFPDGFSEKQLEKVIRQAYRNSKKIQTQDKTVVVIGECEGIKIKMYVNKEKKLIETAYPIK